MTSFLTGLGGGGWGFLAGFLFPAFIAVALVAYLIAPDLPIGLADELEELDSVELAIVLPLVGLGVGVLLNATQTPLYRVLEGYSWPAPLRGWGTRRHEKRRTELRSRLAEAQTRRALDYGEILERLHGYPTLEDQVAPTQLGNALRAFEVYGYDKFRLDSQTMWSELESVVPDSLRTALERARVPVDFCVSCVFLSLGIAAIALTGAVVEPDARVKLLAVGGAALLLAPFWYRVAVTSTRDWRAAVQALVNLGRVPLAKALGLRMPTSLDEERKMWQATISFVRREEDPRRVDRMNQYRSADDADAQPDAAVSIP